MKWLLALVFIGAYSTGQAQTWKTLPKGVRIVGYRNVTTSKIRSNFDSAGAENSLGAQIKLDAYTLNALSGNFIQPGVDVSQEAFDAFRAGYYKVDAEAQLNVHGTGFGYGITDKVMFYGELAYYQAHIKARLKRTAGNTYAQTAEIIANSGSSPGSTFLYENLPGALDIKEQTIQAYITGSGYEPLGDWHGTGYGDMETGLMVNLPDLNYTGLMFYPGVVLPTGRQDDPDILQDVGFGDGQYDFFSELGTGYIMNDQVSFGLTGRYTYQAPTTKTLRVPDTYNSAVSSRKGEFDVKYGDKLNVMMNGTYQFNDWISVTPYYRFMYQQPSQYTSDFGPANEYLARNSDKKEHQVQLTLGFSSIMPFLKKQFVLPAQININAVDTIAGQNVPKASRFEVEFRMLF